MGTLEAPHYEEARSRLRFDPVVIKMAQDLKRGIEKNEVPEADYWHPDGSPTSLLMNLANHAYRDLGGSDEGQLHIGAVAEVLTEFVRKPKAEALYEHYTSGVAAERGRLRVGVDRGPGNGGKLWLADVYGAGDDGETIALEFTRALQLLIDKGVVLF